MFTGSAKERKAVLFCHNVLLYCCYKLTISETQAVLLLIFPRGKALF